MSRHFWIAAAVGLAVGLTTLAPAAQALDEVTFGTNWKAQAEQGGFYQAVADGIYERYGLDVTIRPGGPQVNVMQLFLAGQSDFAEADSFRGFAFALHEELRGSGVGVTCVFPGPISDAGMWADGGLDVLGGDRLDPFEQGGGHGRDGGERRGALVHPAARRSLPRR